MHLSAAGYAPATSWRLAYKPILPEPARSVARKQVAIWPSVPQAQSSRLSSVFFPFSVFQPILNVGLRLPASSLIPLRRSRRPCGFVEPLCFTGAAQSAFLAPSEPLGHASPASSRQRSATLAADFGLVDPIASILQVRAKFGFNNAPGIFSLRSFDPALQGEAIF